MGKTPIPTEVARYLFVFGQDGFPVLSPYSRRCIERSMDKRYNSDNYTFTTSIAGTQSSVTRHGPNDDSHIKQFDIYHTNHTDAYEELIDIGKRVKEGDEDAKNEFFRNMVIFTSSENQDTTQFKRSLLEVFAECNQKKDLANFDTAIAPLRGDPSERLLPQEQLKLVKKFIKGARRTRRRQHIRKRNTKRLRSNRKQSKK